MIGLLRQSRQPFRRVMCAVAGAALVVVVSGCGLVGVRVSDEPGGPLRIGSSPTMGPEPEPEETENPALAHQTVQHVTFTGNCPARMSVHVPNNWTGNASATSFNARPSASGIDGPRLNVYCSESFGDSASDAVASSQRYTFSDASTNILAERTGQAGPGYFWTFEADLGPDDSLLLGDDPASVIGSIVAYPIAGKVYEVRFNYYFTTTDSATRAQAAASIENITVEGSPIGAPRWSGDQSDDDSDDPDDS